MLRTRMTLLAICLGLCASVGMTSSASPQHSHHRGGDSEFAARAASGNMAEVALGRLGVERAVDAIQEHLRMAREIGASVGVKK